ncbi:MAG: hypothetical protein QW572_02430 [Candidatus Nitrosocaldus sp.]
MMVEDDLKNDKILRFFLERSLFSDRQFDIIYNRIHGEREGGISRGAYYRILRQSREKVEGIIYSLLLLKYIGMLDSKKQGILIQLLKQVDVISHSSTDDDVIYDVIYDVIDRLVKGMSKV